MVLFDFFLTILGSTDSCFGRISNPSDCFSTKNATNDVVCPFFYTQTYPWCADQTKQNQTCYSARIGNPCCSCDLGWIEQIKSAGISIYTVGVGNGDTDYMKTHLATYPSYAAYVDSYENLPSIVGNILSSTCITLNGLQLHSFCGSGVKTSVYGSGFVGGETYYRVTSKKDGTIVIARELLNIIDTWDAELSITTSLSDGTYLFSVTVGSSGVWTSPLEFLYDTKCQTLTETSKIWPFTYVGLLILLLALLCLAISLLASLILVGMKKKPRQTQRIELKAEEIAAPDDVPEPLPDVEISPEPMEAATVANRSQYFLGGKVITGLGVIILHLTLVFS